jgi:hypothetical protein
MRLKMTAKALTTAIAAVLLMMGAAAPARADIVATLDNSSLTGAPGGTLKFYVTLENTSATDTIYFNSLGTTASSPYLNIDTTPFFANAPLSLDPGASSGDFEFFDVTIDPSTPDGPYIGSFVSIQGGADGGAGSAFDDLADVSFDVDVQSPVAAPEPGTFPLLMAGLVGLLFIAARTRIKSPVAY